MAKNDVRAPQAWSLDRSRGAGVDWYQDFLAQHNRADEAEEKVKQLKEQLERVTRQLRLERRGWKTLEAKLTDTKHLLKDAEGAIQLLEQPVREDIPEFSHPGSAFQIVYPFRKRLTEAEAKVLELTKQIRLLEAQIAGLRMDGMLR